MQTKIVFTAVFFSLIYVAACNNSSKNNDIESKNNFVIDTLESSFDSIESHWNCKIDSMLNVAKNLKQDTLLARLYFDIGDIYLGIDNQKAKEYYLKVKTLSEKLNWNEGYFLFAVGFTDILNWESLIDSSIVIHQQALELAKEEMNELWIAKILSNIGTCYNYKRWIETALNYYIEALPIFEKRGEKYKIAHIYSLMTAIYNNTNMQNENLIFSEKALGILNEKPDTLLRGYILVNYAVALTEKRDYEQAEKSLLEAQRIFILNNSRYNLIDIYINLANIAAQKFDINNIEIYANKALEMALEFGDVESYCLSKISLGYSELFKENFQKSENYAKESLKIADEYDLPFQKVKIFTLLSDIFSARHDFRTKKLYDMKRDSIQKIFVSESVLYSIKELEAKYESEKKELKITALEEEKRHFRLLTILVSVTFLLIITLLLFLWRFTVQKRLFAETRIKQLEQEQQLVATNSILEGETKERSRLARDLHDSLGGILSGTKLNLQEMKKGLQMDNTALQKYESALVMLDESVREMRRVAHHLMPDSLTESGIKQATAGFCKAIPQVSFNFFGNEVRYEPKLELVVYRIMQELVNNALKHSGSEKIIVQIFSEINRISLTVQDNGCGFDAENASKGVGLNNIRNRVASCNGNLMIDSKEGVGTEVSVEFEAT